MESRVKIEIEEMPEVTVNDIYMDIDGAFEEDMDGAFEVDTDRTSKVANSETVDVKPFLPVIKQERVSPLPWQRNQNSGRSDCSINSDYFTTSAVQDIKCTTLASKSDQSDNEEIDVDTPFCGKLRGQTQDRSEPSVPRPSLALGLQNLAKFSNLLTTSTRQPSTKQVKRNVATKSTTARKLNNKPMSDVSNQATGTMSKHKRGGSKNQAFSNVAKKSTSKQSEPNLVRPFDSTLSNDVPKLSVDVQVLTESQQQADVERSYGSSLTNDDPGLSNDVSEFLSDVSELSDNVAKSTDNWPQPVAGRSHNSTLSIDVPELSNDVAESMDNRPQHDTRRPYYGSALSDDVLKPVSEQRETSARRQNVAKKSTSKRARSSIVALQSRTDGSKNKVKSLTGTVLNAFDHNNDIVESDTVLCSDLPFSNSNMHTALKNPQSELTHTAVDKSTTSVQTLFKFTEKSGKRIPCPLCSVITAQWSLRGHLKSWHDVQLRTCSKCRIGFTDLNSYSEHYAFHLQEEEDRIAGILGVQPSSNVSTNRIDTTEQTALFRRRLTRKQKRKQTAVFTEHHHTSSSPEKKRSSLPLASSSVSNEVRQSEVYPGTLKSRLAVADNRKQFNRSQKFSATSQSSQNGCALRSRNSSPSFQLETSSSYNLTKLSSTTLWTERQMNDFRKEWTSRSVSPNSSVYSPPKKPRLQKNILDHNSVSSDNCREVTVSLVPLEVASQPFDCEICFDAFHTALACPQSFRQYFQHRLFPSSHASAEFIHSDPSTIQLEASFSDSVTSDEHNAESVQVGESSIVITASADHACVPRAQENSLVDMPSVQENFPVSIPRAQESSAYVPSLPRTHFTKAPSMRKTSPENMPSMRKTCVANMPGVQETEQDSVQAPSDHRNSLKQDGYECTICHEKFQYHSNLLRHKSYHTYQFVCGFCRKAYEQKVDLFDHFEILHEGQMRFRCKYCERKFEDLVHFETHMKVHKDGTVVRCTVCNQKYSSSRKMLLHLKSSHGPCETCGESFLEEEEFLKHMRTAHRKKAKRYVPQPLRCRQCDRAFLTVQGLLSHRRRHHSVAHRSADATDKRTAPASETNVSTPTLVDVNCKEMNSSCSVVSTEKTLSKHQPRKLLASSSEEVNMPADVVRAKRTSLQRYLSAPVSKLSFAKKVNKLAYAVRTKRAASVPQSNVPKHKHLIVNSKKCTVPGIRQDMVTHSHSHNWTHNTGSGSDSLKCKVCFKVLSTAQGLKTHYTLCHKEVSCAKHAPTVTADGRHKCPKCDKSFHCRSNIFRHIRLVHDKPVDSMNKVSTGLKPLSHKCSKCGKGFGSKTGKAFLAHAKVCRAKQSYREQATLKDHQLEHACTLCEKVFMSKKSMIRHMMEFHKLTKDEVLYNMNHMKPLKSSEERCKLYLCKVCKVCFTTGKSYKLHLFNRHGGKSGFFQCRFCRKVLKRNDRLLHHIQTHHPGKLPFLCRECNQEFGTTNEIFMHKCSTPVSPKQSEKKIVQSCQKPSKNIKTEDSEYRYRCNSCNVGFYIAREWTEHMQKHFEDQKASTDDDVLTDVCSSQLEERMTTFDSDLGSTSSHQMQVEKISNEDHFNQNTCDLSGEQDTAQLSLSAGLAVKSKDDFCDASQYIDSLRLDSKNKDEHFMDSQDNEKSSTEGKESGPTGKVEDIRPSNKHPGDADEADQKKYSDLKAIVAGQNDNRNNTTKTKTWLCGLESDLQNELSPVAFENLYETAWINEMTENSVLEKDVEEITKQKNTVEEGEDIIQDKEEGKPDESGGEKQAVDVEHRDMMPTDGDNLLNATCKARSSSINITSLSNQLICQTCERAFTDENGLILHSCDSSIEWNNNHPSLYPAVIITSPDSACKKDLDSDKCRKYLEHRGECISQTSCEEQILDEKDSDNCSTYLTGSKLADCSSKVCDEISQTDTLDKTLTSMRTSFESHMHCTDSENKYDKVNECCDSYTDKNQEQKDHWKTDAPCLETCFEDSKDTCDDHADQHELTVNEESKMKSQSGKENISKDHDDSSKQLDEQGPSMEENAQDTEKKTYKDHVVIAQDCIKLLRKKFQKGDRKLAENEIEDAHFSEDANVHIEQNSQAGLDHQNLKALGEVGDRNSTDRGKTSKAKRPSLFDIRFSENGVSCLSCKALCRDEEELSLHSCDMSIKQNDTHISVSTGLAAEPTVDVCEKSANQKKEIEPTQSLSIASCDNHTVNIMKEQHKNACSLSSGAHGESSDSKSISDNEISIVCRLSDGHEAQNCIDQTVHSGENAEGETEGITTSLTHPCGEGEGHDKLGFGDDDINYDRLTCSNDDTSQRSGLSFGTAPGGKEDKDSKHVGQMGDVCEMHPDKCAEGLKEMLALNNDMEHTGKETNTSVVMYGDTDDDDDDDVWLSPLVICEDEQPGESRPDQDTDEHQSVVEKCSFNDSTSSEKEDEKKSENKRNIFAMLSPSNVVTCPVCEKACTDADGLHLNCKTKSLSTRQTDTCKKKISFTEGTVASEVDEHEVEHTKAQLRGNTEWKEKSSPPNCRQNDLSDYLPVGFCIRKHSTELGQIQPHPHNMCTAIDGSENNQTTDNKNKKNYCVKRYLANLKQKLVVNQNKHTEKESEPSRPQEHVEGRPMQDTQGGVPLERGHGNKSASAKHRASTDSSGETDTKHEVRSNIFDIMSSKDSGSEQQQTCNMPLEEHTSSPVLPTVEECNTQLAETQMQSTDSAAETIAPDASVDNHSLVIQSLKQAPELISNQTESELREQLSELLLNSQDTPAKIYIDTNNSSMTELCNLGDGEPSAGVSPSQTSSPNGPSRNIKDLLKGTMKCLAQSRTSASVVSLRQQTANLLKENETQNSGNTDTDINKDIDTSKQRPCRVSCQPSKSVQHTYENLTSGQMQDCIQSLKKIFTKDENLVHCKTEAGVRHVTEGSVQSSVLDSDENNLSEGLSKIQNLSVKCKKTIKEKEEEDSAEDVKERKTRDFADSIRDRKAACDDAKSRHINIFDIISGDSN